MPHFMLKRYTDKFVSLSNDYIVCDVLIVPQTKNNSKKTNKRQRSMIFIQIINQH